MAFFIARYDLRCPDGAPWTRPDLYAAALDQTSYCDAAGFDAVALSEHHGVDDGYLPSPLVMAAAVVARTTRIPVQVAALLPALHDPVALAEQIVVLDHLSRGRVSHVLGLGYRRQEYALFGVPWDGRGARLEANVVRLLQALAGRPVAADGTVGVTPRPWTQPRPLLFLGGASVAAARRAARLGLGFLPQVADPDLVAAYEQACRDAGHEPGMVFAPSPGPAVVFCARRPDEFWERHGHHLLHDARSYDAWHGDLDSAVRDRSTTVADLRAGGVYAVLEPDDLVERCRRGLATVATHPLCGGLPADASWESLRLLGDVVLPAAAPAAPG